MLFYVSKGVKTQCKRRPLQALCLALCFGSLPILISCLKKSEQSGAKIVGGTLAQPGKYDFMAAIVLKTDPQSIYCGGALIAPSVVLTAGHCFETLNEENMQVLLGKNDLTLQESGQETHDIKKLIVHDHFKSDGQRNDIALLILDKPSAHKPIKINKDAKAPTAGSSVKLLGWGYTQNPRSNLSPQLKEAILSIVANDSCKQQWNNSTGVFAINDQLICTGTLAGGVDACGGDSGGPVFNAEGEPILYGAANFSQNLCGSRIPSVNVRVSAYAQWISDNLP